MSKLTRIEMLVLPERFRGAYELQIKTACGWKINLNGHFNSDAKYRLYPILPKGLPEPTQEMIDRAVVYVGCKPNTRPVFRGFWFDSTWTFGEWAGPNNGHYFIDPTDPNADAIWKQYQQSLKGETEMTYRKLEVFEKPEAEQPEYPKLHLDRGGYLVLKNKNGKIVGELACIDDGCLVPNRYCEGSLQRKGMATDWAQWEEDGSIKRGEPV